MGEPEAPRADPEAPPVSERICEAVCLGFAWWTLCAHSVVAAGGSLAWLIVLYAATGAAVLFVARRLRTPMPPLPSRVAKRDLRELPTWLRPAGLAIAACAACAALLAGDPIALWFLLLLILGGAAVAFLVVEAPRSESARRSRASELGLFALALACALYTLFVHRPDTDDAFYVNMAVAAIDLSELPLLARETLHGRFDLPIHYAAYRLHSYELWNGAVSLLSGVPPIYVFHWIAAALAAALLPLCHAQLFRRLTPHYWLWTTLALVVVLGAVGETHRWYGNFAFVRMWQGKAITLFVFTPLVYAYAIRFAENGNRSSWLRLAAAQIAALGCSSAALWAAPLAALMAMCCVLRPNLPDLRRLGAGALASGYLVAAGLLVKGEMSASIPELAELHAPGEQLANALHTAFGDARLYVVAVASIFLAWACAPRGLAQRFAIALPLAVTLVLFHPWADAWVRANVTGPSYWRTMWALPAPILMALVLVAPLGPAGAALRRASRPVCLVLLAAFVGLVPVHFGFSEKNEGAQLDWPRLKVAPAHRFALTLNELAPRRRVVAPRPVAAWIPISRDHAYPLIVRSYLKPLRERVGEIAYRNRVVMTALAEGDALHPRALGIFERGLELFDVQAVCIRNSQHTGATREILRRAGFLKHLQGSLYEIWARTD